MELQIIADHCTLRREHQVNAERTLKLAALRYVRLTETVAASKVEDVGMKAVNSPA